MASSSMMEPDAASQLQVRFRTKQNQYAIPDTPYAIAATVSTSELNTLVNAILKDNPDITKKVNFDFIVFGEFLRTSLSEHLQSHEAPTESTVDIEYLERLPAPKPHDCLTHDDWVAAVSCRSSWIVSGCYDNSLHLWTTKGAHKLAIPGHTSPVKAVSWVSLNDSTGVFISGSHDQTAMIWEWDIGSNAVECIVSCRGHDKSIDCIDVTDDGSRFVTGSWDTNIKIWSAQLIDEDESASKKTKVDNGKPRSSQVSLSGHREAVSGVKWMNTDTELASSSWDHTLKIWDVDLAAPSRTIASNKPFFSLDWNPQNRLLLTSSADKIVRVFDHRLNVDTPTVNARGHTSWVSAAKWGPNEEYLFVSAGHDMLFKMWDLRSPRAALYEMSGHTDKLLCCDWVGQYLISGGADNAMRIYKSKKPASQ